MNARIRYMTLLLGFSLMVHKYYWLFAMDLSTPITSTTLPATKEQIVVPQKTPLRLPNVVQRSLHIRPDPCNNITAAICHKSLFGDIDLWMVLDWVAYHRLLGFDRIFMSYLPEVRELDGFDELESLPYVTLFQDNEASVAIINNEGYKTLGPSLAQKNTSNLNGYGCNIGKRSPVAQLHQEMKCLDEDAKDFDWVLLADADEYLWFKEKVGIKEFLHQNQQYDYMSFGIYCTMQNKRGKPLHKCAKHNSKAKVMVKPNIHHGHVCIHGNHVPRKRKESIQFSAYEAHFKEWHGSTLRPDFTPVVRENVKSFPVFSGEEANIRGFGLYPKNKDGKSVSLQYDEKLQGWLDFLAMRGRLSTT